jgi:hypothetical protein
MTDVLLIQFQNHPQERELIGKMLLAYGELEFMFLDLLRATLGNDVMTAVRTLYRVRSETMRMEIGDALIRPRIAEQSLTQMYEEARCAMRQCKSIRNNYAHAQWISHDGTLRFGNLDAAAKGHHESGKIDFRPLALPTLQRQYAYFAYTGHALLWVSDQYRIKTGQERSVQGEIPKPKKLPVVSLDSHQEARSRQSRKKAQKRPQ